MRSLRRTVELSAHAEHFEAEEEVANVTHGKSPGWFSDPKHGSADSIAMNSSLKMSFFISPKTQMRSQSVAAETVTILAAGRIAKERAMPCASVAAGDAPPGSGFDTGVSEK